MYSQFKYQTYHIFFGWWVYVRGVFGTGGYCPAGICPWGICPRTILTTLLNVGNVQCLLDHAILFSNF